MDKNNFKKQNAFISEEEKTINWEEVQASFKKTFEMKYIQVGWKKFSLIKEFNDYLILGTNKIF